MEQETLTFGGREVAPGVYVIDIDGEVTPASEAELMAAYERAGQAGATAIVLDFTRLGYMNSGGIGLLITLLVRTQRTKQRLLACGLSDHYRQILALTRLDEAIEIHTTQADAVVAVTR